MERANLACSFIYAAALKTALDSAGKIIWIFEGDFLWPQRLIFAYGQSFLLDEFTEFRVFILIQTQFIQLIFHLIFFTKNVWFMLNYAANRIFILYFRKQITAYLVLRINHMQY